MGQKILLFEVDETKAEQIRALNERLQIETVVVTSKDYFQSLGYLAGIDGFEGSTGIECKLPPFPKEMLVFCGMTSEDIDVFLAAYKEAELPVIELKAMITPTNINWSPQELFGEILMEHMMMQQQ